MALKSLILQFPFLVNKHDNEFKFNIGFLKHSDNIKNNLSLGGGVHNFDNFAKYYKKNAEFYGSWSPIHPVIVLVDNDKAGNDVFKLPNNSKNEDYYYKCKNLYFLRLPHSIYKSKENTMTKIEDLYNPEQVTSGNQKKMDFATKTIPRMFNKISFDGFIPLLNLIEEIQIDFKNKQIAKQLNK